MNQTYRQYLTDGERAGSRYALKVPQNVPLGTAGIFLGNRAASSLEFKEHREYEPGDDLRRIDWGAYARSDKLIVKLYREEVNPHLDVVIDGSRSMVLDKSAKAAATLGLAAVFAAASANSGYSHCAWIARKGYRRLGNGTSRPSVWEEIEFDDKSGPAESFGRQPPAWRPQGIRVLISDLLWVGDPLAVLGRFRERATAVFIVQVLAEADMNPPDRGNLRLVDSETDAVHDIYVDATTQKNYREALLRHQHNWHLAARQVGAVMTSVVAEKIVKDWHLEELVAAEILKVM